MINGYPIPDDNGFYLLDRHGRPRRAGHRFDPGARQADGSGFPEDFLPGGRFALTGQRPLRRPVVHTAFGAMSSRDQSESAAGGPRASAASGGHGVRRIPEDRRIGFGDGDGLDAQHASSGGTASGRASSVHPTIHGGNRGSYPVAQRGRGVAYGDIREHPRFHEGVHLAEIIRHLDPYDVRYLEYTRLLRDIVDEYHAGAGQSSVPAAGVGGTGLDGMGGFAGNSGGARVLYPHHSQTRGSIPEPLYEWPEDQSGGRRRAWRRRR